MMSVKVISFPNLSFHQATNFGGLTFKKENIRQYLRRHMEKWLVLILDFWS